MGPFGFTFFLTRDENEKNGYLMTRGVLTP